jgi:hypothetical protein
VGAIPITPGTGEDDDPGPQDPPPPVATGEGASSWSSMR